MECLKSSFLFSTPLPLLPHKTNTKNKNKNKNKNKPIIPIRSYTPSHEFHRDPWSPHTTDPTKPKPRHIKPKAPLSDDNARRIIKRKAQYLSVLRRNQGPQAQTPRWIKRTPEQMVQYLQDDRNGQLYGKHVIAAIKKVRALSSMRDGEYDMRLVMRSFVGKLTFKEMCVVLKEQKGWRQARDFFAWMKLQLSYHPSVIVYTIILRLYGQVGKLNLAEEIFLEMLDAGCEPDEVACGTMLSSYARWGRHKSMLSFYSAVKERGIILYVNAFNFMLSSLQKKSLHREVVHVWKDMVTKGVVPNDFTYKVVISSLVKEGLRKAAFVTFEDMKNYGFVPDESTYNLLINLNVKNGNRDEVQRLYDDMRFRGVAPSNYTCATLISLYYKYEDYPRVLSLFSEMARNKTPADEVIYGLLIRVYGKLGLYEDACRTFKKIKHKGLLTNEKTYLAMAQVHLTSGNVDKALEVIGLMKSRKICFSRFAYIVLLQCYVTKEDVVAAEGTFLALCKTGLPDAGSCNDMLNLYVKLNLINKAKEFMIRIRDDGTPFDEKLYRKVMKVYCKEGMLPEAEQLTNQMVKNESLKNCKFFQTFYWILCEHKEDVQIDDKLATIKPTDKLDATALGMMLRVYLTNNNISKTKMLLKLLLGCTGGSTIVSQFIIGLTKDGDISKAESLNHQLITLGCRMEEVAAASLISHYGKQHMLKQAEDIFAEYVNSPTSSKLLYNSMIDAFAKCGKQEKAYLLYKQATAEGLDLGAVGISIVVNALTNEGKYKEAENIISQSLEENLKLDTVAYNTFIKSMLEAGKLHCASSIFERMCSNEVAPSIQTYNTMISVYGKDQKLDRAVEMFNKARSLGVPLDEKAYMNLIGYYGKAGMIHEASQLFSKMQEEGIKPGKISYNIMIYVYANAGVHHEVEKLFQAMHRQGCLPDSSTYLSLVKAYTESLNNNISKTKMSLKLLLGCTGGSTIVSQFIIGLTKDGDISKAESLNHQLITLGCRMEEVTAASLISHYGKQHMLKQAEDIFAEYVNSPTSSKLLYNSMIDAFAKCGKQEKAYLLYKQATAEGLDLGAVGISIVVNALTNEGKYKEAENIISQSLEENLKLDTVAYNTFIKSMLEAGKLHCASSIFERMCSNEVAPSIQTYNTMISVYGKDQKLDRAVEMFNKARSLGVPLDEKAYMNLIGYYGKAGMIHEASQLFSKMQEEGIKPGKISYNIMIYVYANAGVHHEVEKLFQAMHRQGCLPDSSTYLSLVKAYTESLNYSKAEETIHDMQSKGISPSCAHFNILLSAFIKAGLIDEAKRVYEEISTFGLIPDLICYRTILKGYLKYGRVEEGINFFEIICKSIKGDIFVMSVAVHLYKSAGMENQAKEILSSMNKMRIPFLRKLEVGSAERVKVP